MTFLKKVRTLLLKKESLEIVVFTIVSEEIKKGTKQKYCFVNSRGAGEISYRRSLLSRSEINLKLIPSECAFYFLHIILSKLTDVPKFKLS